MHLIFALIMSVAGKPIAEYTRMSVLQNIFDSGDLAVKRPELSCYLFDTSGYFDDVSPVNSSCGFRYVIKEESMMVYDYALTAFKRNKNTYFQIAPDFVKSIVEEDDIGLRLTCSGKSKSSKSRLSDADVLRLNVMLKRMGCNDVSVNNL